MIAQGAEPVGQVLNKSKPTAGKRNTDWSKSSFGIKQVTSYTKTVFDRGEKANIFTKLLSEFDFDQQYKCKKFDKNFGNEVTYENHYKLKCSICDACGRWNCLNWSEKKIEKWNR